MGTFYWAVCTLLIAAWAFPRRWLHVVGVLGCAVMSYRAWFVLNDMPSFALSVASAVMHGALCFKIWVMRRPMS